MREMKAKVGKVGARLKLNAGDWSVAACLFADDTVLLAESERELQRVVDQFHSVCSRRKLRVNAGKSKVMVFERKEVEVVDFGNALLEWQKQTSLCFQKYVLIYLALSACCAALLLAMAASGSAS